MSEHPKNEPFDPTESPSERLRAATARYKEHNDGIEKKQSEPPDIGQTPSVTEKQIAESDRFRREKLDAARLQLRTLRYALRAFPADAPGKAIIGGLIEVVDVLLTWGVS